MKSARILIIEDSERISELLKTTLEIFSAKDGYKYEVALAYDGVQGLELVWKLCPDVIVLDIQMPKLNGYEVLASLRSVGNTTPVIMMTGTPREEDQVNGLFEHNAYITKPFSPSLIYHHVKKQLPNCFKREVVVSATS